MTDLSRDDVHSRTLTAFFDSRDAADRAISDLEAAGIPRQHIQRVDGGSTSATGTTASTGGTGFLASLKDMLMPEEDRYGYAEGLGRGGYLVSVRADEANYTTVMDVLDRDGAVDMDQREASWRTEGWKGYQAGGTASSTTDDAATGSTTTAATASVADVSSSGRTFATSERSAAGMAAARQDEVIPVYEEQLKVGKRDVSHGRVRLRSYVVETPVQEQVALHSERVEVERRPVDRVVTSADVAFQDRTIELEESAEEAVVSKDVRVIEEVGLRRVAQDRTETVSDKVRHTEVEIEDGRTSTGAANQRGIVEGSNDGRIVKHMEVYASDGTKVGTVDHMDGSDRIKLAKNTSPDGQHYFVPMTWVEHVDQHVHLNKTVAEMKAYR